MPQSFTYILTHAVWATHLRTPWLSPEVRKRVFAYISGICRKIGAPLRIAGGVEDHVHTLFLLHPTLAPADVLRDMKANSSRFVHETWPDLRDFKWQDGYSAFGVSRSGEVDVYRYIEDQERHHARRSVEDELRELYEKHGLPFDPVKVFE